jgi:Arc/MetJ-type ribon-helix-helix transcriptional regulator
MTAMQINLDDPRVQRFIAEQVESGRFPTPEAAVQAAVERMMLDRPDQELDRETIDAINRAEEQLDRGEGIDFAQFAAEMRKKMAAG